MYRSLIPAAATLAVALLLGQVTDRTTGQPLRNVQIQVTQGHATLRARTGADGRFEIKGIKPGAHTLRYSSDDVPPQTLSITVKGAKQQIGITACSTTLDYSCASGGGS